MKQVRPSYRPVQLVFIKLYSEMANDTKKFCSCSFSLHQVGQSKCSHGSLQLIDIFFYGMQFQPLKDLRVGRL